MSFSPISYTLRRSLRARNMRITIRRTGEVVVTAPFVVPALFIQKFVLRTQPWINRKMASISRLPLGKKISPLPTGRRDFLKHKDQALQILSERSTHFNQYYNFTYNKVVVRNQETRWGSCSRKGTISFNYRLAYLPDNIRDYVIVHELCHLQEFNHSKMFWALVEMTVPDYKIIRKKLKGLSLL